jgi:glycosyltransferase involved in cell wall biosynthesis
MFCSTIIPTINRSTLTRAVMSVLNQDFDAEDFEVIVVNDSGKLLPDMQWMDSNRVRVIDTSCRERSVARNTGAAIAKGRYFHFLDDDDILLPGALRAFWQLDQQVVDDAVWLHGSYQTMDNNGHLIEKLFPEHQGNNFVMLISGESIPLGDSLISSDAFYCVGEFDATFSACEDRDLGRRLAMVGNIAYTQFQIARFRVGLVGSTTNWAINVEEDRRSREKALNLRGALSRAIASAKTCIWHGNILEVYWRGRLCRAYIASMIWNLRRKNVLIAVSRGISCLKAAGTKFLYWDFWLGLRNRDLARKSDEKLAMKHAAQADRDDPHVSKGRLSEED